MTIYVDDMRLKAKVGLLNGVWSHMFTEKSARGEQDPDLDDFAAKIGLKARWIQNKPPGFIHYDVTERVRQLAIKKGAVEVNWRETPRFAGHANKVEAGTNL